MGHESIRKRRLKSEEIARKDRTRCLVFRRVVGYSGANRAVPDDALGWPSHTDTGRYRCRYWLHKGLLQQRARASLEAKMV